MGASPPSLPSQQTNVIPWAFTASDPSVRISVGQIIAMKMRDKDSNNHKLRQTKTNKNSQRQLQTRTKIENNSRSWKLIFDKVDNFVGLIIKIKETYFNAYEEKLMWIILVATLYISSVGEESETSGGDALGETGIKEFLTLRPSLVTSRFGN